MAEFALAMIPLCLEALKGASAVLKKHKSPIEAKGELERRISIYSSLIDKYTQRRRPQKVFAKYYYISGYVDHIPVAFMPDSGSDLNIVSWDFVERHGLEVDFTALRSIRLPNNSRTAAIGTVSAAFRFKEEEQSHDLTFSVVPGCPEDVILGKPFLKRTETLTTHKTRIHETSRIGTRIGNRLFFLNGISSDRATPGRSDLVPCTINGQPAQSLPDLGSDIMVVSGDFARRHNFKIREDLCTEVELADGSKHMTNGTVLDAVLEFDLPPTLYDFHEYLSRIKQLHSLLSTPTSRIPKDQESPVLRVVHDLHVVDNLPCDIILGAQFTMEHNIFDRTQSHLDRLGSRSSAEERIDNNDGDHTERCDLFAIRLRCDSLRRRLLRRIGRAEPLTENVPPTRPLTWSQFIQEEMQTELQRREKAKRLIDRLPEPDRTRRLEEEHRIQEEWNRQYESPTPVPSETLSSTAPAPEARASPLITLVYELAADDSHSRLDRTPQTMGSSSSEA
ncbi:hypothetical protein PG984_009267 [Apiospora sp. TS-2023a]